jgi:cardiolipin synthase
MHDPLGVFSRDHRKCLVIDGRVAFVSGLCVGQDWAGYAERGIPPWRDTGVELSGAAVADVQEAFAKVWATMGSPLPEHSPRPHEKSGTSRVRIIGSSPGEAHVYRLDQILASAATETMWITDAYFVGVPSYLQSLKDAARDDVDVRVLVPRSTDLALVGETTRSTYRALLEAGVRVFEWNGPMVHAKTAVFDGRFSRVGSTNLNIASWFANYELDVFVECDAFGREMQETFLDDLQNSTEIVLENTYRVPRKMRTPKAPRAKRGGGSVRKATAGALNAATSIGSAIAQKSPLGAAESRLLMIASIVLIGLTALFILFPRVASIPIIAILLILAIPTLVKAIQNYRNN